MNEYTENLELPEGLQEFLEQNAIPCPPIPLAVFPLLLERDENFFATNAYAFSGSFLFWEDLEDIKEALKTQEEKEAAFLKSLQEENEEDPERAYLGFGLFGYGLQSKSFQYLLHTKNLTFAFCLPWGLAYSDSAFEREELENVYETVTACLCCTAKEGHLSVLINADYCHWKWADENSVKEGSTIMSLLDFLEQADDGSSVPEYMWTRV